MSYLYFIVWWKYCVISSTGESFLYIMIGHNVYYFKNKLIFMFLTIFFLKLGLLLVTKNKLHKISSHLRMGFHFYSHKEKNLVADFRLVSQKKLKMISWKKNENSKETFLMNFFYLYQVLSLKVPASALVCDAFCARNYRIDLYLFL